MASKDEEAFVHMAAQRLAQVGLLSKGDSVLAGKLKVNIEHVAPEQPMHTLS